MEITCIRIQIWILIHFFRTKIKLILSSDSPKSLKFGLFVELGEIYLLKEINKVQGWKYVLMETFQTIFSIFSNIVLFSCVHCAWPNRLEHAF